MARSADIIVIGGGMAGMSAAGLLSRTKSVILLEREDTLAYHSTGRSAAAFIHWLGNDVVRELSARSYPFFENPPSGFSENKLIRPRGVLLLGNEDNDAAFERTISQANGFFREIDLDAAKKILPMLKGSVLRTAFDETAMDLDVDAIFSGFRKMLLKNGGKIVTKSEVCELCRVNGEWRVATLSATFNAPIVVNAAGAWADHVALIAGTTVKRLQPRKRTAAIIPVPQGTNVASWPLAVDAGESFYCRPDAGRLMVSPANETPVEPQDAYPEELEIATGLHHFSQSIDLPIPRVESSWAGLRTFAPDETPCVGFDPKMEGFYWLAGQGGVGIQTAPALAQKAAQDLG